MGRQGHHRQRDLPRLFRDPADQGDPRQRVFPELREEQFTPVRIRLGMQDEKNPKSFQSIIVEAIEHMLGKIETTDVIISQQLDENAIDFLWNYFIRHIFYNKSEKETKGLLIDYSAYIGKEASKSIPILI